MYVGNEMCLYSFDTHLSGKPCPVNHGPMRHFMAHPGMALQLCQMFWQNVDSICNLWSVYVGNEMCLYSFDIHLKW